MKIIKKLFPLLGLVIFFTSCEKDVHIDIPKKDPKLVINAILAKDSVIRVVISKTRGVLEPENLSGPTFEPYIVDNVTAVVYENGVVLDTLVDAGYHYGYVSMHSKTVKSGNVYVIRAVAPGFEPAEATSTVPSQSEIANVTRVKNARTDRSGNPEDEITVTLNDPVETNFYMIEFPVYCVSTTDKDIEPLGPDADPFSTDNCYDGFKLMMKDVNFNGRQKQVRFYINSYSLQDFTTPGGQVIKPKVTVYRITEDHFKFVKSYDVYFNSSDNPFAEPANVYSNVRNGYGIFTVYTEAAKEL